MSNFNVNKPPGGPYDPQTLLGWLVQGVQTLWRRLNGVSSGGGSGSGTNIYNSNGSLTGDRTVSGDNNLLTLSDIKQFSVSIVNTGDTETSTEGLVLKDTLGAIDAYLGDFTNFTAAIEAYATGKTVFIYVNDGDIVLEANGDTHRYQFGDVDNVNKRTTLDIKDATSTVDITGNKNVLTSPVSFTGAGLDDLTLSGSFAGLSSVMYIVTIDSTGSPNTFTWTDGSKTVTGVPITGGIQALSNGVIIQFNATTGHTINNSWNWSYTLTYGKMMSLNGAGTYAFGDVDVVGNGTGVFIDDINRDSLLGDSKMYDALVEAAAADKKVFLYVNGGDIALLCDGSLRQTILGDAGNYNNQTKVKVDDIAKATSFINAVAMPTMQVLSSGSPTISDGVYGLYYDPASLVASATITTPPTPVDGQEITILFGGTITSGAVVTALTIAANTAQGLIGTYPTAATTDTVIIMKYRASNSKWYRKD